MLRTAHIQVKAEATSLIPQAARYALLRIKNTSDQVIWLANQPNPKPEECYPLDPGEVIHMDVRQQGFVLDPAIEGLFAFAAEPQYQVTIPTTEPAQVPVFGAVPEKVVEESQEKATVTGESREEPKPLPTVAVLSVSI